MRKLLLLVLLSPLCYAQFFNRVKFVTVAPSGACTTDVNIYVTISTGALTVCKNQTSYGAPPGGAASAGGVAGQIQFNQAGSLGGFTASGDASVNTTTGVITVSGIHGVALSGLATGILKNTTATGVPSIAVAGDFPVLNQNTTGTAANLSGTPALPNGTTATTQTTADTSTDLATDAFVHNAISGIGGGTGNAAALVTLSFSATPTFTCPSATAGTVVDFQATANAPVVLTGNITSSTLATCTAGALLNFLFKQDATGGRTVAMPTGFDSATVHPAANVTTKLTYYYDGANGRLISSTSDAGYGAASEVAAPGTPPASICFPWFDSTNHDPEWKCNNSATTFSAPAYFSTTGLTARRTYTFPDANATIPQTIASGTAALGTGAIASGACATVVTATATGTATTDVLLAGFNGDPTAVTGYIPASTGMLTIIAYPTANTANFKVCNNTASSITPGAITLNWRVTR